VRIRAKLTVFFQKKFFCFAEKKVFFLISHVVAYQAVADVLGAFKGLSRASEAFSTQTPQSALNRPQNQP
jgi:hypothetical protein